MLEVKYHRNESSLKSVTAILTVVLLVFCKQFGEVITTTNEGVLVMFVGTRFTCNNGTSIRGYQRCDGIEDCLEYEDEEDCACRSDEFQCTGKGTKACIPEKFHCDGTIDCYDKTDEIGCLLLKREVDDLVGMRDLYEGDTFTASCVIYGVPIPEIVWYRRGGEHVSSKCTSTRVNRRGVLTCSNIEPADSGTYNCEAINTKKFIVHARAVCPECGLRVHSRPSTRTSRHNFLRLG